MKSLLHLAQYTLLALTMVHCAFGDEEPEEIPGGGDLQQEANQEAFGDQEGFANQQGDGGEAPANQQGFNNEQGFANQQGFNNEQGFANQQGFNNEQGFNNQENFDNGQGFAENEGFDADEGEGINSAPNEFLSDEFNNQGFNQGQANLFANQGQFPANGEFSQQDFEDGEFVNNAGPDEFGVVTNESDSPVIDGSLENSVTSPMAQGPLENGVVRYVLSSSSLYSSPGGSTVAGLVKGDHPLVSEEGEWSRTSDGYYIPSKDLTPMPVGRTKRQSVWQ